MSDIGGKRTILYLSECTQCSRCYEMTSIFFGYVPAVTAAWKVNPGRGFGFWSVSKFQTKHLFHKLRCCKRKTEAHIHFDQGKRKRRAASKEKNLLVVMCTCHCIAGDEHKSAKPMILVCPAPGEFMQSLSWHCLCVGLHFISKLNPRAKIALATICIKSSQCREKQTIPQH